MSLTNPNTPVNQQDLQDFYHKLLPYLGGSADAGFTPVGSVIAIMGVTAPANYLACNGQIVNVADYPELANYFLQQFGSKNKFGGDGTSTFGIPDLRGEFLRGTGTNSHTNQGSGAAVGTHQNATEHVEVRLYGDAGGKARFFAETTNNTASQAWSAQESNADTVLKQTDRYAYQTDSKALSTYTSANDKYKYTSRPTNTSILWCIATKNIFLNPSLDYSTDEKVVGTWFDESTIYQKTIIINQDLLANQGYEISLPIADKVLKHSFYMSWKSMSTGVERMVDDSWTDGGDYVDVYFIAETKKILIRNTLAIGLFFITIQYTKTT